MPVRPDPARRGSAARAPSQPARSRPVRLHLRHGRRARRLAGPRGPEPVALGDRPAEGRLADAAAELQQLAQINPRDREVQRQLAHTLYGLGRLTEARTALESIINIDPTDFGAYEYLVPIFLSAGLKVQADRARELYLQWRDDPLADGVAARFFAAHPQWADERIRWHIHSKDSSKRPILTGGQAAAVK